MADVPGEHFCHVQCPCKRFERLCPVNSQPLLSPAVVKAVGEPGKVLQVAEHLQGQTWFHARQDQHGQLVFGCWVCGEILPPCRHDCFARFEIQHISQFKPCRITAHGQSADHVEAMRCLIQGETFRAEDPCDAAPSLESYECLLSWIRKGGRLRKGMPSLGHYQKCKQMAFTMAEALKRLYRSWLQESCSISLLRDERRAQLLVRFRCADSKGRRHVGTFGRVKAVKGTASRINELTMELVASFCTRNAGAPQVEPSSLPACDQDLLGHIRTHLRALTVDAASNEVAAGQAVQSEESTAARMQGSAFAPNMTVIIRDKAHGSRRVLERPWHCDPYLESIARGLITDSCSLAQLVQWSPELRTWYEQACTQSSCCYISTTFQSLRAAKHRFESLCTPLSRICLDPEAALNFLHRLSEERRQERGGQFASLGRLSGSPRAGHEL